MIGTVARMAAASQLGGYQTPSIVQMVHNPNSQNPTASISSGWANPQAGNLVVALYGSQASLANINGAGWTHGTAALDNQTFINHSYRVAAGGGAGGEDGVAWFVAGGGITQMTWIEVAGVSGTLEDSDTGLGGANVTSLALPGVDSTVPAWWCTAVNLAGSSLTQGWTNGLTLAVGANTRLLIGTASVPTPGSNATTASWTNLRRAAGRSLIFRAKAA